VVTRLEGEVGAFEEYATGAHVQGQAAMADGLLAEPGHDLEADVEAYLLPSGDLKDLDQTIVPFRPRRQWQGRVDTRPHRSPLVASAFAERDDRDGMGKRLGPQRGDERIGPRQAHVDH